MKIKNTANGGRGLGIAKSNPIEWAAGETKEVDAAVIAKAKEDPTNAAMFDSGDLVVVVDAALVPVIDPDAEAKAAAEKLAAEEKAKADAEAAKGDESKKGAKK